MLLNLIIVLVLLGVGLYLLNVIPMDASIKIILRVVVILCAAFYVVIEFLAPFLASRGIG